MFKKGDILKLNKLGLKECSGGKEFRLKFIEYTEPGSFSGTYDDKYIYPNFTIKYYEIAKKKINKNEKEILDALKYNEDNYYV